MTTLLALLAAVLGFWALRRERHGWRAAIDAGALALVLAVAAAGAWIVAREGGDGVSGALAGVVVGSVLAQWARDRTVGR
ncbi:hypothetical protein [Sphingomonas rubra]|uniref:PEP-CTERM protein-sorting domain-containing protein n=1 Tax=Sphingomonas rubra TaxID=634430 RepID=A0A1I5T9N4_9SPHN|nr:hypothetical protein [Sphingomonas rubra]SFP79764.1 PEP-CTERM protein-sorting domain-containing protein [Sphingomonas rubra]